MQHLDEADPTEVSWEYAIALLAGELAALRTRLAAVETAVGRPGPVGAPAPPTLPTLARRVTTLERQAGIVPGLDLLAGTPAAPARPPAVTGTTPRTRGQVWRDRSQVALAAALLLAVFVWLLRPAAPRAYPAPPAVPATNAPTATAAISAMGGPVAAPSATPVALTGEPPCTRSDTAPCSTGGSTRATTAGTTWTVEFVAAPPLCDLQTPEGTCASTVFPAPLVIQAGDTVVWTVRAGQHTVTFPATGAPAPPLYVGGPDAAVNFIETPWQPNPLAFAPQGGTVYDGTALVGSGGLNEQSPDYRLTFPQPGHYTYLDLEQPALMGEVIVLPAAGAAESLP